MIYVLQVQPSRELIVCTALRRSGIEAYTPRRELLIHKSGMWTKIVNVLFPGYAFIDVDYNADVYHTVKHTDGVIRFLGMPSPLPHAEAELMKWLFNGGEVIGESKALMNHDDTCVGFEGFLHGCEGKVTYFNKRQRKAQVAVRFGGKIHKANLGVELVWADKTSDSTERG